MTAASARQWERVEYQAPIQLSVHVGGPEGARTLTARAVNVSEGGIQVRTDDPLPIGEPVTCSMLLEGRPAALLGRVRWTRSTAPGFTQPGAGIQFDELSELDSDLLRHLVARGARGEQPVELFFPHLNEPVHARAFTSDGGLYITAALPLLNREAPVEFRFSEDGPRFKGRIARVAVRERGLTPHLEIELAIHAREAPRFRRYTMYDDSDVGEALAAVSGGTVLDTQSTQAKQAMQARVRVRAQTLRVWDSESAQPTAEPELAFAAQMRDRDLTPIMPMRQRMAARMPRAVLLLLASLVFACALATWILRTPAGLASRSASTTTIARPTKPAIIAAAATAPVVLKPAKAALLAPSVALAEPAIAAPSTVSTPPTAATLEPRVRVDQGATEVTIPVTGSLDGVVSKRWASPLAVVVDLPNATLAVPASAFTSKMGVVSRVTLTRADAVTHVRVFLSAPARSHDVQLRSGMLVIRVEPDLRGQDSIRH